MDNRKMHLTTLLLLIFLVTCINCNFLVMPQAKVSECANKAVTLTWTIESFTSAGFVSWIYNSTTLIMRQSGPTNRPVPQGSYVGRVENGSNSDLIIKSPLTSDTGGYQCSVTYNNGTEVLSDVVSLYIYDNWAVTLKITKEQKGQSATLTSNVYDPSVQQTWSTGAQGSSITVTEDGVYSLCISGGRAECLDPSSTNCTSYSLKIEACNKYFFWGFWIVWLIVVVSSVIICILKWKKNLRIEGCCKKMKINIAIFIGVPSVAVVIGVAVGIWGTIKCFGGIAFGFSIGIGLFIVVVQWIFILFWNCKKGCDGNSEGKNSTIQIQNLPVHIKRDKIEALLSGLGKLLISEQGADGQVYVTFDTPEQAQQAVSYLNGLEYQDRTLKVKLAAGMDQRGEGNNRQELLLRETSDRSIGDRARTPASATGINLEAKKKSQNKPTEKGTEASSLTNKTFGQPLPETPNARKNQLEPLRTDSFEVENSTTERKKKKKKKKKRGTSEGNEASEEKEERPELEFKIPYPTVKSK